MPSADLEPLAPTPLRFARQNIPKIKALNYSPFGDLHLSDGQSWSLSGNPVRRLPCEPSERAGMSAKQTALAISMTAAALSAAIAATPSVASNSSSYVKCMGANVCKGTTECKTAKNACRGQNTCKGQGWVTKASAEECTKAGGHVAPT